MKNISPQKSNSLIIDICKFIGAIYGCGHTYNVVESFRHRGTQCGVCEFYLLRRTMFLYGVGLSDCKSNGVAVYGK